MDGIVTNNGRDFKADLETGIRTTPITHFALGEGLTDPQYSDKSMESEVHRQPVGPEDITVTGTGAREYSVAVAGGTDVTPGTEVTEYGLLSVTSSDEILVYHETDNITKISQGTNQEFVAEIENGRL